MLSVKDVLIEVRRLLIEVGWCTHVYSDSKNGETCAYCLAGALLKVIPPDLSMTSPSYKLREEVIKAFQSEIGDVRLVDWNDRQSSVDAVITVIDKLLAA